MSMSGWCSSSSATSATVFTKSMASTKSSNSKVRSMCFFSNSHSGIFFMRSLSSGAFIKSAITGQRVTPENRFATPKRAVQRPRIFRRFFAESKTSTADARASRERRGQFANKMKAARRRQIFCRSRVLRHNWSTHGEKRRRAIAQPTGFPAHIDALDRGELADRARQIASVFFRRSRNAVWINNMPAAFSQSFTLGVVRIHVHREFEFRFDYAFGKVEVPFERVFF